MIQKLHFQADQNETAEKETNQQQQKNNIKRLVRCHVLECFISFY